jgi:regulator of replication initiation timing
MNVEGVTKEQLWQVINENTELKQENYMLKSKLDQINRLLQE